MANALSQVKGWCLYMKKMTFKTQTLFISAFLAMSTGCSFKKSSSEGDKNPVEIKRVSNEDEIQTVLEAKLEKGDLSGALNYALYNDLSFKYVVKKNDESLIELVEKFPVQDISKASTISLLQAIQKKNPVKVLEQRSILVVAAKSMNKSFFSDVVQSLRQELVSSNADREELSIFLEEVALESASNNSFGEIIEDSRLSQRFDWIKYKIEVLGNANLVPHMNPSVKVLNSYLYSNYIKQNPMKALELLKALDAAKASWDLTHAEQLSVFTTIYAVSLPGSVQKDLTLFFLSKNRSAAEILTSECDLATPYILDPIIASFKSGNESEGTVSLKVIKDALKGNRNLCQNGIEYIVDHVADDGVAARLIKSYVQIEGISTEEFIKKLQIESRTKKRTKLVAKVRELIPADQQSQFDLYTQIASSEK